MADILEKAAYFNDEVMMSGTGKYIVIEGNDGTGKSTQVAKLAEYFRTRGQTVCVVEEPGSDDPEKSTPIANELRNVIKNGDLARSAAVNVALFSVARRELWREKIQGKDSASLAARRDCPECAQLYFNAGLSGSSRGI